MPATDHDIVSRAFATPEWRSAADALYQATGITVTVMDFSACEIVAGNYRCAYCHLAADAPSDEPLQCFAECPPAGSGPGRITCRAGLAALHSPVLHRDDAVAHIVVSGFVTSTRERRARYEYLLSRGVTEDSARRALKALPVIARRQAESYLQVAVATAGAVYDTTLERLSAAERVEEMRFFVSAGRQVASTENLDATALSEIAEEAVALVSGEAGAILRPRGSMLEVVARTGEWRGSLGALVPCEKTASGRAVQTGRTVVAPGRDAASSTLAVPLALGSRVIGVLEVRVPTSALPLGQDRIARVGRFGQFVAIALEREDEREAVKRAMTGYAQLNELAATLGGQTDIDGVAGIVASVVDKAFTYDLSGLVLVGWGRDRADVAVSGTVAQADVDHVLEVVAGRVPAEKPFEDLRVATHRGEVGGPAHDEWAVASAQLTYGDLMVGWLFVARCDGMRFSAQDGALLEGIAAHAGAAFGRAALFGRIRDDYAKTIAALSATLDFNEAGSQGHAGRVMEYAMMVGEELGLGLDEVEQLRFAGLLHDIGKSGVAREILLKPSKLSAEELAEVRRHAEIGASIVDQIEFLKSLTPIILHHHERWDGKGYPAGLKGDKIPLLARILAVADAFDAMTAERSFTRKLTIRQARKELEGVAGTQFDPRVVAALFEGLDRMALAGKTGLLAPRETSEEALPS